MMLRFATPLRTQLGILLGTLALCVSPNAQSQTFTVQNALLAGETCQPTNNAIDPGEQVLVRFSVLHSGTASLPADTVVSLLPTGGIQTPGPDQPVGPLAPGAAWTGSFSLTAAPLPCGSDIVFTLQFKRSSNQQPLGTASLTRRLGVITAFLHDFANSTSIPIADSRGSLANSAVFVSGLAGRVTRASIALHNLTHTYTRDLDIVLVGPQGQKLVLLSDSGAAPGATTAIVNGTLVLSDDSPAAPAFSSLTTGTYRPTDYEPGDNFPAGIPPGSGSASLAAVFGGDPSFVNGLWTLYLVDDQPGDDGTLNGGWSLQLEDEISACCKPGAPALANLADVVTNEDTPIVVALSVSDNETGPTSLVVSAFSDNATLVPSSFLITGGAGVQRTLNVIPAADRSGSALITVIVRDPDGQSTQDTFQLTVLPVNDPPNIGPIPNLTAILTQTLGPTPFTLQDAETPAENLTLFALSSNPALLPKERIQFAGSGATRSILLPAISNVTGTATITVGVVDGDGLTATRDFTFTVVPSHPPVISSIPHVILEADRPSIPVPFTISDPETPADQLTLLRDSSNTDLLPIANIVLGGNGTNRTVTVFPAPGQTGDAVVTIAVRDTDTRQAITQFLVTVFPSTNPPFLPRIPDQTMNEDTSLLLPIDLVMNSADAPAAILSATSSDPLLLPNANLVVEGSGTFRSLRITPAANQSGSLLVHIQLTSPIGDSRTSFNLLVRSINDPPTVTTPTDISILENATASLGFLVSDIETPPQDLRVTVTSSNTNLVPNTNLRLTGLGPVRALEISPAPNASGSARITLVVTDASGGSAAASFTATITPLSLPPIPPTLVPLGINPANGTFDFRFDGDGRSVYQIQKSTDLQTWTLLETVRAAGPFTLRDTLSTSHAFYRVVASAP